jgi:hypothetical protein
LTAQGLASAGLGSAGFVSWAKAALANNSESIAAPMLMARHGIVVRTGVEFILLAFAGDQLVRLGST